MTKEMPARRFSLEDQAKALAVVLREEFGVPFTLYHASGALVVEGDNDGPGRQPLARDWATLQRSLPAERPSVTALGEGGYRLVVPVLEGGNPVLVAIGTLAGFARTAGETAQEQVRLQKWLQAVTERLRPSSPGNGQDQQSQLACQAILVMDQLLSRLRIHKDPVKHQQRILHAAADLLKVRTLAWIPRAGNLPVTVAGEPCLSTWDFRQLAALLAQSPDLQKTGILLENRSGGLPWINRYSQAKTLIAFAVGDQPPLGWVVALGRKSGAGESEPFRRSDVALLTPFVSLLDFHVRSSGRYFELKELLVGLARSLTSAIDAKDAYTYGHSERVARVAVELGRELGLPEDEVNDIYLAGLLHDIGKIGIRDDVLGKPGALTRDEFEHIKQHVTIGFRILKDLQPIRHLLPGVLYHHERFDGKGYPEGLVGETIPQLARILAVADGFDAMSTSRPYRSAMPMAKVEEILRQGMGSQWDPRIVEAFFRCRERIYQVRQRGIGESLCQALDTAVRKDGSSIREPISALMPIA